MKTTIEIPDAIFHELKKRAVRERTTLRSLIESALLQFLSPRARNGAAAFKLRDGSVPGRGTLPGVEEGNWRQIRDLAYEGRGT